MLRTPSSKDRPDGKRNLIGFFRTTGNTALVEGRTTSWLKLRKSSRTKRTKPPKLKEVLSFDQFGSSQLALHVVDTPT
jgi:hypothetical protein